MMNKNRYISPQVCVTYVDFEGLICSSIFNDTSLWINDVVEGQDYGCL